MVELKFHSDGFQELLTSDYAKAQLDKQARRIAAAANAVPSTTTPAHDEPYYRTEDASNSQRARVQIKTTGPRSVRHEHLTQALLRSL